MNAEWSKGSKSGKKDSPNSIHGRWRVSTFFFLLISVHSLLIPWLPLILQLSGLKYYGIAIVMCLISISSVFSIKIALTLVTISRSGAFRRLMLFFLLASSLGLYISSVIILPNNEKYMSCNKNIDIGSLMDTVQSTNGTNNMNLNATSISGMTLAPSVSKQTTVEPITQTATSLSSDNSTTTTPLYSSFDSSSTSSESLHSSTTAPNNLQSSTKTSSLSEDTEFTNKSSASSDMSRNTTGFTTDIPETTPSLISISEMNNSTLSHHPNISDTNSIINQLDSPIDSINSAEQVHSHNRKIYNSNRRNNIHSNNLRNRMLSQNSYRRPKFSDSLRYNIRNRNGYRNNEAPIYIPSYGMENENLEHLQTDPSLNFNRYKRDVGMKKTALRTFNKDLLPNIFPKGNLPDNSSDEEDANDIKNDAPTEHTWIWVSLILIIASLLGSGIESSVTRLWHCYSHGYHLFHNSPRYDLGGDDLLERTLTDTFELSAAGEHYGWSRLLAGVTVLTSSILLAFGCQIGLSPGWSLMGQTGVFTILGIFSVISLIFILPIPYGSIRSPKSPRPLSLYLDDEVLWEGLRRIASPTGTAVHGIFCAVPKIYVVLVLSELARDNNIYPEPIVVLGVACSIIGEGLIICCRRSIATYLDSPGLVSLALGLLALQMLTTWYVGYGAAMWFVSLSWIVVGMSQALTLISVRQNALMLATISDQEREAWVSWCSGQFGLAIGIFFWPIVAELRWGPGSLKFLLLPLGICSAVLSVIVFIFALITRSRRSARRRVYHTLDLHSADEGDSSDENEDWLVKGARKEGISLD